MLYDFNSETIGYNRKKKESILEYIRRVMNTDTLYHSKDYALADFVPHNMKELNAKLEMCDETYYFSLAAGIRNRKIVKQREMLKEPMKTVRLSTGYDINFGENVRLYEDLRKVRSKAKNNIGFIDRILTTLKIAYNPLSFSMNVFFSNN